MSRENLEVVQRCLEAFDAGDYDAALDVLHPDIAYDMTHVPDGQIYRGHDGVREAFRLWMGTWEDYHQERGELIDAGDEVIVPVVEHGRGKGSGVEMQRTTYGIWTLRDGKAIRIRFQSSRAEALADVGVRE